MSLDALTHAPNRGLNLFTILSITTLSTLTVVALCLSWLQPLPGLGTTITITVLLIAAFFFIMFRGRFGARDALAIYDDRIVIAPSQKSGSEVSLTIPFADLESVALEKSWIRLRQTSGRRLSFSATRLHAEDAFDLLAERVELANPKCAVKHR